MKYFLGYSEEGFILAKQFMNSTNSVCKDASDDYMKLNMNPKLAMEMFQATVESLEKMGDIRRGFYCSMCDSRTQARFTDYYFFIDPFYNDRIYLSNQFCHKLVDATIRASYFNIYYLKIYLESITKLMSCKTGTT